MKKRRLHILVLVLGLAMVWLGFLYTYELKIADKTSEVEVTASSEEPGILPHTAGLSAEAKGLEKGFPILLAGLGIVFLAGGATRFRQQEVI